MNEALLEKIIAFKKVFESDQRIIVLNEMEKILEKDEEVMRLSYRKDQAISSYEDAQKHFGKNSVETAEAQKALYKAKLELDNNRVVNEYNKAYREVWLLYAKINRELFGEFSHKSCEVKNA